MISELKKVERILCPTDLSENAGYAFAYAIRLADCYGARITILHVLEELPPNFLLIMHAYHGRDEWEELQRRNQDKILRGIRDQIQTFCDETARNLPECPYTVDEIIVETGHPVERILHHIEKRSCDMVVMGSRGQGFLKEALLGSTSHRVLRRSSRPVLVVPLPSKDG